MEFHDPLATDPGFFSSGQASSSSSLEHGDDVPLASYNHSESFSNARNFTINGAQFISAGGSIVMTTQGGAGYVDGFKQDTPGLIPGLRAFRPEDLIIKKQLYKGRGYRLHAGRIRGRAVMVKVFAGRRAKELCSNAAKLHGRFMHPSFLRMTAGAPHDSELSFIAFEGDFESTLESRLASALTSDVRESFILGLQTVISSSLGLDYLQDLHYPLSTVGSEHLRLITNSKGDIVVDFDPEIPWDPENNGLGSSSQQEPERVMKLLDEIIQKTFSASCKAHYKGQRASTINDALIDSEEELCHSGIEELEDESDGSTARIDNEQQSFKIGHRRELVWKPQVAQPAASLDEISQRTQDFLDQYRLTFIMNRRRGRPIAKIAHCCQGYKRTEILLTANIERSAIVAHTTPVPGEICPVCRKVVEVEAPAPSQRNPQRPIDYDKQCAVINDKGMPCSRSVTCKAHAIGAKRAVQGRSRKYDELLLQWQRANNPNFVEPVERETKAEKREKLREKEELEKKRLAGEADDWPNDWEQLI